MYLLGDEATLLLARPANKLSDLFRGGLRTHHAILSLYLGPVLACVRLLHRLEAMQGGQKVVSETLGMDRPQSASPLRDGKLGEGLSEPLNGSISRPCLYVNPLAKLYAHECRRVPWTRATLVAISVSLCSSSIWRIVASMADSWASMWRISFVACSMGSSPAAMDCSGGLCPAPAYKPDDT